MRQVEGRRKEPVQAQDVDEPRPTTHPSPAGVEEQLLQAGNQGYGRARGALEGTRVCGGSCVAC